MKQQNLPPIPQNAVRFQALGGLGEVGMNCALLETRDSIIMIDCGVNFPEGDHYGIDVLIPDFSLLDGREDRVVGLIVTHGHMDHIGAIPYLLKEYDIPVYAPRFAIGLIREMLREHGLADLAELHVIEAGDVIDLPDFSVEFIHSNHSIPDTLALSIETPAGRMIHTGDFKVDYQPVNEDPIDLARFAELGDEGVRVLFSDSTNIERSGFSGSESRARAAIIAEVRKAEGCVFVTQFSTNIFRMQALIEAAQQTGRFLVPLGFSLNRNIGIAREMGLLRIDGKSPLRELKDVRDVPRSKLLFAVTGSQGEPRAALSRIARNDYRGANLHAGDTVIFSARVIPGNERGINLLMDDIVRQGAHIVTSDMSPVHVSGHACREEQMLMIHLVRPDEMVPVHGDHRFQVKHAALAQNMGVQHGHVLENGDVIEFGKDDTRVVANIPARRISVEGGTVGEPDSVAVRDRVRLARLGICIIWIVMDNQSGELIEGPTLLARGITEDNDEGQQIMDSASQSITKAIKDLSEKARRNSDEVSEAARAACRRYFRKSLQRKPLVEVIVRMSS